MTIIVYLDTKIPVSDLSVHIIPSCYATPNVGYKESLIDFVV